MSPLVCALQKYRFGIRGLEVQELGLSQNPLLRKSAFLSITCVPAIKIEHVSAPSKDLSTRNVFCIGSMVICACGLLPNPDKSKIFNIGHDYALWIRNFMLLMEKPKDLDFETWPKSVGNFMLMINNYFALFQLPGTLLKTKKCDPYFRGNTQYPIYCL
jgi:hypothetical protein